MGRPRTKGKAPEEARVSEQLPLDSSADRAHHKKVDDAFALMEKLDENAPGGVDNTRIGNPESTARSAVLQSGLRIRFGVDALVSDNDMREAGKSGVRPGEANILDFGITLPHIWRIPVFGKAALRLIRHFQKETPPLTVHDILKSLRRQSD